MDGEVLEAASQQHAEESIGYAWTVHPMRQANTLRKLPRRTEFITTSRVQRPVASMPELGRI